MVAIQKNRFVGVRKVLTIRRRQRTPKAIVMSVSWSTSTNSKVTYSNPLEKQTFWSELLTAFDRLKQKCRADDSPHSCFTKPQFQLPQFWWGSKNARQNPTKSKAASTWRCRAFGNPPWCRLGQDRWWGYEPATEEEAEDHRSPSKMHNPSSVGVSKISIHWIRTVYSTVFREKHTSRDFGRWRTMLRTSHTVG